MSRKKQVRKKTSAGNCGSFCFGHALYIYSMLLHSPSQIAFNPERIVSLVPSQTELLFDLGLDSEVAGITKFCIHPHQWRKSKTIVGGTKNFHLERIEEINPDLIIANKEENLKEQVDELAGLFNVWVTDVGNLDDALQMITDVGMLTKTSGKAHEIKETIIKNFSSFSPASKKINACYLIWRNPYMTAGDGTFINCMMEKCGLVNLFAGKKRYPSLTIDELKEKNCELLLLSSEPFPFKQKHIDELQKLLPDTKIMLADGEMFSWYGSRLIQAPAYFKRLFSNL